MTDIKEFFIASNTVSNAPDYDSNVLSTLIHPKSVIRKFRFHFVRKHKIYSNYNE